ncbi:Acyl-CoA dehydrogenase, C-terminal:Acyl-CoA dehydrogenase, central region [Sphingobium indicum BiD32]|uniref:Acyl-CoA dehydrogenase, C-terminal:Acyl-CoA dehydrogenase, central region n=1 Tax=Sphingobium indicum BiD32 TaxID=1301087 RepID=N1MLS6_9SPHN|nr:acyl-CoA dehydrogenase family protein [Sphingobium indicum]CCW16567.1 Acyl-CoA dehydrogenase, C-terminal:Acyl-CoA dehydrogenase, central region [Sphingobium indicum BiD32]
MAAHNGENNEVTAAHEFREIVRAFLADHLTQDLIDAPRTSQLISAEPQQRWHRILARQGWATPSWPERFGGTSWTPEERLVFEEELIAAKAPPLSSFLEMIGPVLYTFGSKAQIERHLAPLRDGLAQWCQGYSEPGAGSDLAGLRTSAVRDGEDYVVNGQKIWTTYAHRADWMFCLVRTRTEGRPQAGISFLLIDMKSPGITIRPIHSIDGLHHLNEIFFSDVRVPTANLVGVENGGWTIAKFLLAHERSSVGSLLTVKGQLDQVRAIADAAFDLTQPNQAREHATIDYALCEAEITLQALDAFNRRQSTLAQRGAGHPAAPSMMKLAVTELQQTIAELGVRALGVDALRDQSALLEPFRPDLMRGSADGALVMLHYLFGRAFTILGGSSEIQRNLIFRDVVASASPP